MSCVTFQACRSSVGPRSSVRSTRKYQPPSTQTFRTAVELVGAARGKFVIERDSGRVIECELALPSRHVIAVIKVTFARDPALDMWLPKDMDERYIGTGGMTGMAEYSGYRQFRVDTSMEIARVPD